MEAALGPDLAAAQEVLGKPEVAQVLEARTKHWFRSPDVVGFQQVSAPGDEMAHHAPASQLGDGRGHGCHAGATLGQRWNGLVRMVLWAGIRRQIGHLEDS